MAPIKTKAKEAAAPRFASMRPDEMVAGGLMDDFDGTITKARLVPWDYNGSIDHHVLALALTIKPEGDDPEFTQHYSTGAELDEFVPSMDGLEPCNLESDNSEDHEGIYAMPVGKKEGLNNNSNMAQFYGAMVDAGFDINSIMPNVDFLEGVGGHFNRMPQKKRSGLMQSKRVDKNGKEKENRNNDILVITELKAKAKAGKAVPATKTKPVAAKASAKTAVEEETADGDPLVDIVVAALEAAEDNTITKKSLSALVLKSKIDAKEKGAAVKRVQSDEFLEGSERWAYDAEEGTLVLIPE